MTGGFFARLELRAQTADTLLCVGLDPQVESAAEAVATCRELIGATAEHAAAFKPNAAFFESLGPEGATALRDVIAAIPDEIPVLLDAKRGDIASSAEAYARAAFEVLGADAVTVSPYLGREALAPFLSRADRGVFVLARTSNPGATDLQEARLETGELLVERVVELFGEDAGFVVGATAPDVLSRIRRLAPEAWILAPGVGPQGADLEAAVRSGIRPDGLGLLVPARWQGNCGPASTRPDGPAPCRLPTISTIWPRACMPPAASDSASSPSNRAGPRPSTWICGAWPLTLSCWRRSPAAWGLTWTVSASIT